jgi:hemerythrin-like domain-containing protein
MQPATISLRITEALLGEHGAMYPLLDLIERTAPSASLDELRIKATCLRSILVSHASIEDAVLRPAIEAHLARPEPLLDGSPAPTDHQLIDAGLAEALAAVEVEDARRRLLETVAKTRKHFIKEETIVFGIAGRELSDHAQEQLGSEWARMRGVFVS